jgi:hypothetical protein
VDCPTAPYYDEKGAPINDPTVKTQRMADCEKQQEINQKNEDQNRVSQRQNNIVPRHFHDCGWYPAILNSLENRSQ